MVDDEAGRGTQAARAETRAVAVARDHEKVDTLGDCADHFALDPSSAMEKLHPLSSKPRGPRDEDLRGRLVGGLLVVVTGHVPRKHPPEQSGGCRFGDLGDVGGCDVKERDVRVGRKVPDGGGEASLPGSLDQPNHYLHGRIILPISRRATGRGSLW
ncbi:MAG TPA: hypothetical protein VMU75_10870 [Acidimicrobiales bacterium]|nr:hypothetical protein [Acidimicrobiales bacterium]